MRETRKSPRKYIPLCFGLILAGLPPAAAQAQSAAAEPAAQTEAPMDGKDQGSTPADLEKLFADGRFAAAADLAARLRAAALAQGDAAAATSALIREVQARVGLGATEEAVRLLLAAPAPAGRREQLQLDLFRGETLSRYFDAYSWEIRQRENAGPTDKVELSKWTADQLDDLIVRSFAAAFEERAAWGAESVAPLAGLLEQNDYPARIRGTLRDTLSYLFAEALGNSSRFTPREANEIYRLDLGALLAPPAAAAPGAVLAPGLHPLERMALVLSDLEAWHQAAGRPEAALEARLTRLESLRVHFPGEAERERFNRELVALLEAFPDGLEWKAMGWARLAEWRRQDDAADALIRAHQAAERAAGTYPDSLGGRRARALLDQLETPSFLLMSLRSDGLGQPSLTLLHSNLKKLHFRAYQLPNERQRSFDTMFRSEARALVELVRGSRPFAEWQAELADPGDYRQHRTHLVPQLRELGSYVILASERADFSLDDNRAQATQLQLTDMVVLGRPRLAVLDTEVAVRAGRDGRALPGAKVELLASSGRRAWGVAATKATDGDGLAAFDLRPVPEGSQLMVGVSRGQDHLFTGAWMQRPYLPSPAEEGELRALAFTDRAVYRPGQKVLFKVVAYREDPKSRDRRVAADAEVTVELIDANGETVGNQTRRTNRHGSVAGEFEIPTGRGLGSWTLRVAGKWISLRVEEYKRPTFELEIGDPAAPLRLNQEARIAGSARYYFGMPLREGEVAWRVVRRPNYPFWWFGPANYQVQQVAAGAGKLDAEGRFEVSFLPRADEALAAGPGGREIAYAYEVSAELTDQGGETRSAQRSFRAGFVAVDARLEPAAGFFAAGEKLEVALRRFDLDGKGRAGQGSWRLLRIADQKPLLPADLPLPRPRGGEKFVLPGDLERPRFDLQYDEAQAWRLLADGPEVARGELAADAAGEARWTLDPAKVKGGLRPGIYRLRYTTADDFGAEIERAREIVVAGPAMPPAPLALVLAARKERLKVGDPLELVAGSGLPGVPAVLEIFRGELRIFRRELAPGETYSLRRAIEAADRGDLVVELTAVAEHQIVNLRRQIEVPAAEPRLEVSYETFRDRLRPGQQERFTLAVRSSDGSSLDPQLVELLAGMYDRSLDLFAPHPAATAGDALFDPVGSRAPVMQLFSSIDSGYTFWRIDPAGSAAEPPALRGDRLTFYDQVMMGGPGGFGGRAPMMRMMKMSAQGAPEAVAMAAPAPQSASLALADAGSVAPPPLSPPPPPPPPAELRGNFAETAFFEPHLQPGDDGKVSFEFTVPDAVTEWQLFTHALSDDFRYGSDLRRARTVKELLVRPYLPRFLREGDRAELRVSIENTAAAGQLAGALDLELQDEETGASLLAEFGLDEARVKAQPFTVEAGHSTVLRFAFTVPRRIGPAVLRVWGKAIQTGGDGERVELADGERRLLPILPSRLHLAQSRFAVLRDPGERDLVFEDLRRDDDPTRIDEKMVVTLDGQLFTSVLRALPYLLDYPYRCTEQNLNRFLSSGILAGLYGKYPAIARLAEQLARRDTPLEPLPASDPNRQILLEESPWLAAARGGQADEKAQLERVLDPRVAKEVRDGALAELRQAQDSSGGFPWWPGGRPSEFFTLYLLQGFARATEFEVEVPRDLIENAWGYLRRELEPELKNLKDPKQMAERVYAITWLNYILSTYPDLGWTGGAFAEEDRAAMLAASLRRWKELPPRLRLYVATTAQRAGKKAEARQLLESVMDGAKTTPDQGTFWLPEERAWLFYWDRIETHALALRTVMEIAPEDPRRHGLVTWLMLNKKLNQWSSTRATAEVIYSLAKYLEREGQLGQPQQALVEFAGQKERVVFAPDSTETRRQMELPGSEIEPRRDAEVKVEMESKGLLFASATWHFSTERLPQAASSDFFGVERRFFRRRLQGEEYRLEPLADGTRIKVGDEVEVELEIAAKHQAEYVHLRDPRGAGFEPVDLVSAWRWDLGIVHYREIRDSATNFFFETLPPGKLTLKYRLRATTAGTFRVGPATLQSMYAPEFTAYSSGEQVEIEP